MRERQISLTEDTRVEPPHVVILGAGASKAAFPGGDKNGRQLPLMADLVEVLDLKPVLSKHGISYSGEDFETLYSRLSTADPDSVALQDIENAVYEYFSLMEIPEEPTLYDHLVLSLREKDIIATFNWDPLLAQACIRNSTRAPLPDIAFLHGNVAIGYCAEDKVIGPIQSRCQKCGLPYTPSRLLYPTETKDYDADPQIRDDWSILRQAMQRAYVLTIFGYRGPGSDTTALALMKRAWGDPEVREYEETEIIDIRSEDDLAETWAPFICSHHYRVTDTFCDSIASNHPRRSCEAIWSQMMEVQCLPNTPLPADKGFADLYEALTPLLESENTST